MLLTESERFVPRPKPCRTMLQLRAAIVHSMIHGPLAKTETKPWEAVIDCCVGSLFPDSEYNCKKRPNFYRALCVSQRSPSTLGLLIQHEQLYRSRLRNATHLQLHRQWTDKQDRLIRVAGRKHALSECFGQFYSYALAHRHSLTCPWFLILVKSVYFRLCDFKVWTIWTDT